jgi:hypothetical protein
MTATRCFFKKNAPRRNFAGPCCRRCAELVVLNAKLWNRLQKLSPQKGCSLAAVLFPEEFKVNKARAIVKGLLWLAEAIGEAAAIN